MNRLLLGIIFIAVICIAVNIAQWPLKPGSPLPSFRATNLLDHDHPFSTETTKGKTYLLVVWASWCPACRFEHAFLKQIATEQKIPIYGLLLKDDPNEALAFLANAGNPYAGLIYDPENKISRVLRISAVPTLFLIDKTGVIRYRNTGVLDERTWKNTVWPLYQQYSRP